MGANFKSESIVLKRRNFINKDIIVTLFTKEYGKINVFAKGVKKITSRRLSHIQTGNLIKALIYKKDDRLYLQETSLISALSQIKKEEEKINCLYFILYILDKISPENQKEIRLYQLIKNFLIELSSFPANNFIIEKYLNKILIILGFLHKEKTLAELQLIIEEIINEKLPSFKI